MLWLRVGEEIVIAGNIHVTVMELGRHFVRLGITAPPSAGVALPELLAPSSPGGNAANGRDKGGGSPETAHT